MGLGPNDAIALRCRLSFTMCIHAPAAFVRDIGDPPLRFTLWLRQSTQQAVRAWSLHMLRMAGRLDVTANSLRICCTAGSSKSRMPATVNTGAIDLVRRTYSTRLTSDWARLAMSPVVRNWG